MLSLVFFGLVVYTFLVVIPTVVDKIACANFKDAYLSYLSSQHVNSYGK